MNETVQVEFDNTLADHLAAERLYYKSTFWSKGDKVAAVVLILAAILLLVSGNLWWALIPLALGILEWFNFVSPMRLRTRIYFKRNPKFLETYHLSFSESGIHFKTKTIDSHVGWELYSRYLEDDRTLLLIMASWQYSVIPKRAIRSPADASALKELIERHLPGARF